MLAREAIRKTMAMNNISGDRSEDENYANTYTEDGILESRISRDTPAHVIESRAAILEWKSGRSRGAMDNPDQREKPAFVRHNLTTSRIELTGPDTASCRSYFQVNTQIGPDHCGVYVDRFRKVDDDWLIAHRKVLVDWFAPNSMFGGGADLPDHRSGALTSLRQLPYSHGGAPIDVLDKDADPVDPDLAQTHGSTR